MTFHIVYLVHESFVLFLHLQQKIREHRYRLLDDMEQDMILLCKNAQLYNMEGSLVSM